MLKAIITLRRGPNAALNLLTILTSLIVILSALGGCQLPPAVQEARQHAPEVIAGIQQQVEEQRAIIAEMKDAGGDVTALESELADYEKAMDRIVDELARLNALYDEDGVLRTDVAQREVLGWLPPQYGLPASLLLGALGVWLRTRKNHTALPELIHALDVAKTSNPELAKAIDESAGVLRAELPAAVREHIDTLRS
jgi:hypothetical protein